ncbi:MAG: cbb3-type cytochrome c oxidase subunit II [Verrucomicrobia bacterium]|nr:cbb3-type cytochrome c oxidase subunit II [Verrucomicrobiota bacterium]
MNNLFTFSFGTLLTLFVSWLAFIVGARSQFGDLEPTAEVLEEDGSIPAGADLFPKDLPGIAKQGAEEYISLGCMSCHTQQVRLTESGFDVERKWGKRPSVARDYILQDNVLLGNTRIGPDLANVGLRGFTDEWLHRHLFDPQATVPGSICPPSPFLFEVKDEATSGTIEVHDDHSDHSGHLESETSRHIFPTLRAQKIVSYLQSLGQNYELPEMAFVEVKEDDHGEYHSDVNASAAALPKWLSDQIASGKEIYMKAAPGGGMCFTCHQSTGLGLPGQFPPLAGSEWVLGDKPTLIKIAMFGLMGPVKVKGTVYTSAMPPPGIPPGALTDQQIADVLTYVRNDWGNSASSVSSAEVATVRSTVAGRAPMQMWTVAELKGDSK